MGLYECPDSDGGLFSVFYVLCAFRMQAIMAINNFLFIVALSNVWSFNIPPIYCFVIHLHKLIAKVSMYEERESKTAKMFWSKLAKHIIKINPHLKDFDKNV